MLVDCLQHVIHDRTFGATCISYCHDDNYDRDDDSGLFWKGLMPRSNASSSTTTATATKPPEKGVSSSSPLTAVASSGASPAPVAPAATIPTITSATKVVSNAAKKKKKQLEVFRVTSFTPPRPMSSSPPSSLPRNFQMDFQPTTTKTASPFKPNINQPTKALGEESPLQKTESVESNSSDETDDLTMEGEQDTNNALTSRSVAPKPTPSCLKKTYYLFRTRKSVSFDPILVYQDYPQKTSPMESLWYSAAELHALRRQLLVVDAHQVVAHTRPKAAHWWRKLLRIGSSDEHETSSSTASCAKQQEYAAAKVVSYVRADAVVGLEKLLVQFWHDGDTGPRTAILAYIKESAAQTDTLAAYQARVSRPFRLLAHEMAVAQHKALVYERDMEQNGFSENRAEV